MTEHAEALGLEQKCVRPGLWHIEGYTVRRMGRGLWYTYREFTGRRAAAGLGTLISTTTLREAREWIWDQRA